MRNLLGEITSHVPSEDEDESNSIEENKQPQRRRESRVSTVPSFHRSNDLHPSTKVPKLPPLFG